ncbi:hypothetical protein MNBD_GAMMA06-200 [hydrothermal vent metagenome]|uniref:DUF4124 domain-containing protein n=1 Tax=hydrothermal vent metagenome TaxID=652676 RepID=A0A3B0WLN6_9ZZZZ
MKKFTLKNTFLATLLVTFFSGISISTQTNAELYKGLDEEGNVVYSDKPFSNSKEFTAPAITVMDALKVPVKVEPVTEEKAKETKYTKFSITAPKNDESIWNSPQLTVSLKIKPALNAAEGHTIWLLMDGKPIVKKSRSLLLQIDQIDRGEHKLQAQVKNKKGKTIKSTKSVTVHIKRTVVRRQAR